MNKLHTKVNHFEACLMVLLRVVSFKVLKMAIQIDISNKEKKWRMIVLGISDGLYWVGVLVLVITSDGNVPCIFLERYDRYKPAPEWF